MRDAALSPRSRSDTPRSPRATEGLTLRARVVLLASAMLSMSAAFVFAKTGRDALFFLEDGLFDLPEAYMGITLLSVPVAMVTLGAMRRFGPHPVRVTGPLVVALILTLFAFVAQPGGGPLMTGFFIFVPLAFGVLFALTWLLGSELLGHLPVAARGRPYSILGAAAIGGGVVAGFAGRALSVDASPRVFVLLGALCLAVASMILRRAHRGIPVASRPVGAAEGGAMRGQIGDALRQRYVLLMLAIAASAALTGVLIEFQFYLAAATSGNDGRENAALFAGLYMFLNLGALAVQLLLVPGLQRRIGVGGSLLVLPGVLVGGGLTLFASGSLFVRAGLRAAEGGLKSSIHRSNWEQAFLPFTVRIRGTAKLLVDGVAARIGEGLAAAIVFVWLTFVARGDIAGRDTTWVMALLVGTAALWLGLVWRLRSLLGRELPGWDELGTAIGARSPLPDT